MQIVPISSLSDAHVLHLTFGGSEPLRRLAQLAYRSGSRTVLVVDGASSTQWTEEKGALFDDVAHKLSGDMSLLVFLVGSAADEAAARALVSAGEVCAYAKVRPAPMSTLVEAFVSPPVTSDVHFITCKCELTLDFPDGGGAVSVSLSGLPFMQQDGMVSRCADASLWIATSLVVGSHADWAASASAVSHKAAQEALQFTPQSSRRIPSGGLTFAEVILILSRVGYDPVSYVFASEAQKAISDHTIYRWVESGLPVILFLQLESELHTVVVCGHTFDPDAWWPGARVDYFPALARDDRWLSSSLWAVEYLVLDDNYGPMLAMTRGGLRNRTVGAIVPVPRAAKLYLAPEDAEAVVANLLFAINGTLPGLSTTPDQWLMWLQGATRGGSGGRDRFVIRTFLSRGSDLAQYWGASGYPAAIVREAQAMVWPDYVWVCEISLPGIYGDRLKIGEVVLDCRVPTGLHVSGTESMVWLNLAGQIVGASPPTFTPLNGAVPLMSR